MLIDTHAHLCDSVFDQDREEVLDKAQREGVSAVITVGENLEDAKVNLQLAETHPMIRAAAGLYPTHLDPTRAEEMMAFIRREKDRLVGIGEVGLDYWVVREEAEKEIQRQLFSDFIDLSGELDLPLNVHSRSAGRHALSLLMDRGACRVQIHAYDGKAGPALEAADAGYFFSIPPSVIRSPQKQRLVRRLPLSCLLIETDSPVLGPDPKQRNEPANAALVLHAVAEIKGVAPESVMEAAFENTLRLYGDLGLR